MSIAYLAGSAASNATAITGATSIAVAVGVSSVAGDSIIVLAASGASINTAITISDNNGNTYTQDRTQNLATDGDTVTLFHADNIVITPNNPITVTATQTPTATLRIGVAEFSGLLKPSLDQVNSANQTVSNPSSGNITPGQPYELVIGGTFNASGVATTIIQPGNGFGLLFVLAGAGAGGPRFAMEYFIINSVTLNGEPQGVVKLGVKLETYLKVGP